MYLTLKQAKINLLPRVIKTGCIVLFYHIVVFLLFSLIINITGNHILYNETSFLNWDAEHYNWIKNNGYGGYRVAFFPLFPMVWKISGLSVFGIVIFNSLLYISGFTFLSTILKLKLRETLILLSIPSLMFMFLPYSEAIFYISGAILLFGLRINKELLVCLGLLLCSLVRPVSVVLIPAILITEFLTNDHKGSFIKRSFIYSVSSLAGFGGLFLIQYFYTGEWFIYFKSFGIWDHNFHLPLLPFTSWGGDAIVRLDGSALLVGIVAICATVKVFIHYFKFYKVAIPKEFLFSILYLAGISALILLLFRGGSLFSLNRFIYATPFFAVGFYYFLKNIKWNNKQIGFFILGVTAFWLLFNSFVHIQTFFKFGLVTLYLSGFLFMSSDKKWVYNTAFFTCLICNIVLQLYFYYRFLNGEWVG